MRIYFITFWTAILARYGKNSFLCCDFPRSLRPYLNVTGRHTFSPLKIFDCLGVAGITVLCIIFLALSGCSVNHKTPAQEFKGQTAEEIFAKGEKSLASNKYETAIKSFEALDALYPFSPYQQQAQLDLIYAYYQSEDFSSAAAQATRFIHLYPRSPYVDYAYYMKGIAHFNQERGFVHRYLRLDLSKRDLGTAKEAFTDFAELIRRFPESQYAPDARERMIYLRNMMAQHELDVAEFYYQRKMYVAAENRANYIVRHYQNAPQIVPALGLMVKANQQLGLHDLALQYKQILQYNYPESSVYQSLLEKQDKSKE